MPDDQRTRWDELEEAARQLDADGDPENFRERLAGLLKHKPVEEMPE